MSSKFKLSPKIQAAIIRGYGFSREQKIWLKHYTDAVIARDAKLFMRLGDESIHRWGMSRGIKLDNAAAYLLNQEDLAWGTAVMDVATELNKLAKE
ncbi:MAG: hypothetical protein CLLPBCKN_004883 [Chroococcidiopsis cubana SAG 39.79]|uniref:Uncharacterized protein n=1 Tax=Chroococcidiopsis cubana SAG 39.79 TaxID=388085 RepID=A0AB37UJQ0_9CYAN|nr:hypothetical protein [Chroococcidiopsis cubana]MDZ4875487.1 hypothetical protein [Chroococcidiopsis cubana SAG 39.79]PSB64155.1 hypothetical protein C7B79_10975 [Chroococcidiopsis cubana CCALA 043]RUT11590.1 hypothetical protein DSM107010_30770 [Chroococcidiopsis cubana SAG 39.79]